MDGRIDGIMSEVVPDDSLVGHVDGYTDWDAEIEDVVGLEAGGDTTGFLEGTSSEYSKTVGYSVGAVFVKADRYIDGGIGRDIDGESDVESDCDNVINHFFTFWLRL